MKLHDLRRRALNHTLFTPASLGAAVERLGFVQFDPIRAPARAQDLILRHRVADYRAGDLGRFYPSAPLEEAYLYAYGTMPRATWELLRPRAAEPPTKLDRDVLEAVREAAGANGGLLPRELDEQFGRERAANDWGGHSRVTKLALERLHRRGLLRVAGRVKNVRRYALASPHREAGSPRERLRRLIRVVAQVLAPVLEKTLMSLAARLRRKVGDVGGHRAAVNELYASGELESHLVDGLAYVWPAGANGLAGASEPERRVRFLAPFDPVVWDRQRFEHLWGWAYRFEAYTPVAQRVRGYYAMPVLFGEHIVGWANASRTKHGLDVALGFVDGRPAERDFGTLADAEIARLEASLTPRSPSR